jgi:hypothetical protein
MRHEICNYVFLFPPVPLFLVRGGASQATLQQAIRNLDDAFVQLVCAEIQFAEDTRDDMHLSGHAAGSFSSSAQRHEMNLLDNLFADLGDLTADIG